MAATSRYLWLPRCGRWRQRKRKPPSVFRGAEIPALLAGDGELEPRSSLAYAAYTLVAGAVFRDPLVEELFDGVHIGPQMINALPRTLDELLTPYGRELLDRPKGGLAAGLRKTDSVCKE